MRAARVLRHLAGLPDDHLDAIYALGQVTADEHVRPRRLPSVDRSAIIHPTASLRFAERVQIGARASVGPHCCIWGGWSYTWARVGVGALLSPGVLLAAGNHGIAGTGPIRDAPFTELDVEVGAGAWIGANATVVGCRVGAGAVVGAGSVVLQDVPDLAIAVGIPARVVGTRG